MNPILWSPFNCAEEVVLVVPTLHALGPLCYIATAPLCVILQQCDNYLKMCNDSVMYFKKLFFPTYL